MKLIKNIVVGCVLGIAFLSNTLYATPNSSIDLSYKGNQILTNYKSSNAHQVVAKLDAGKIELEMTINNELISQDFINSVSYVELNGNQKLEFEGTSNGIVTVTFSGINIDSHGKGKKSGVKFDWDLKLSNIAMVGEYNFLTGHFGDLQLLSTYSVDVDIDAHGIGGLIIDAIALFGFDTNEYMSEKIENKITDNIRDMFNSKFNGFSKSLFSLEEIIPNTIMYQGTNVSSLLTDYLVSPLVNKSVTITTDLDVSTNQSVSINLWNDVIITAKRLKPIIRSATYHNLGCQSYKRVGYLDWNNTNTESYYVLQRLSGSSWYSEYTGSATTTGNKLNGGTYHYRVNSLRQDVQGEWKYFTANIPTCSGGGSVIVE